MFRNAGHIVNEPECAGQPGERRVKFSETVETTLLTKQGYYQLYKKTPILFLNLSVYSLAPSIHQTLPLTAQKFNAAHHKFNFMVFYLLCVSQYTNTKDMEG